ncbi:TIGR02117 family protein [Variovorax boronicumulans]|uniref:TIGR02117 family protein n=1 Tax=Variovorax boronicumulans TaxID=436515 RepID=A0A250DPY5_9BURK|nr:TIGR02117 family protein [Variovorax boronicumulans]ATA56344.1 TIGR02117 family protein [Variovorax boronicumulans]
MIRRWLLRIAFTLLGLLLAITLYVAVACALVFLPANAKPPAEPATVEAWVLSNGVHTDLVFPVRSATVDWLQLFPLSDFKAPPPDAEFVAIGWGDREFYLHTPTWGDLTAARAFGALSGGNRSLLHVTYLQRAQLRRGAYKLPLSQAQYAQLVAHVRATLPSGRATPIAGAHYASDDAFYEAQGSYHLFETCNTWTGRGLRQAGVTVSRWTPFDFNVTWHLQPVLQP